MDAELLRNLIPLVLLLAASAYFSGSEAAFFSLSSLERDQLSGRPGRRLGYVMRLIRSSPDQVLITVLTGNMFVNVFASSLGEAIGIRLFRTEAELFSIIAMTALLLIAGEMIPKNLGVRNASAFASFSAGPLFYLLRVLAPVRWFLNLFNLAVEKIFPARKSQEPETRHSFIRSAVHIGFKEGILDQSELHLVESFCEFREQSVEEVMTPRTQIKGVEIATPISTLLATPEPRRLALQGSIIPVFDRDLDHITGYLTLYDLLPYRYGLKGGERLQEAVRPGLSVPSSKNCADLLVEMRASNTELAIVVDEFGGTAGVVTIKALVEKLLGYFYPSELDSVHEVSANTYRVPGSLRVDQLELLASRQIATESHTVAGLILEHLRDLPEEGARVRVEDLELVVLRTSRNQVLEVEVRKASP
ncbi:MAG: HlyC/CorC family transporter [Spirochaetales bacterium]|nr:HlyC/CorC family transporter [Spirochaetales bacterium]